MKKIILFTLALVSALLFVAIMTARVSSTEQPPATCPAGSYDIGISKDGSPLCKLEPTGCPYGDSIPMDMCDKFKAQVEPVQPVEQAVIVPAEHVECGGK